MAKRILIIDDHPIMHRELEKILKSQGFESVGAFDALAGIRRAREEKPDLILLDVKLPDVEGDQVVRSLKTDPDLQGIPIIFMTVTLSRKDDEEAGQKIEVDGVSYLAFAKPLYYPIVIKAIHETIRNHPRK